DRLLLARLTGGALFGEMALLSRAPRAASVIACRPSILLVGRKDALDAVAEREPEVAVELATHCRRRMVQNLVRTSPILSAVQADERPALVERFETRVYEKGEKLIAEGNNPTGLHLLAPGDAAVPPLSSASSLGALGLRPELAAHGARAEALAKHEEKQARRVLVVLSIMALFFAVELAGAVWADSDVLRAEALHLLTDVAALG